MKSRTTKTAQKGCSSSCGGVLDEHYCFFKQKDVDWNEIHFRYGAMVSDRMTDEELFSVCSDMLDELKDGHTNLSAPFATSYYKKWWSDYPQNYDARLVEESYFNFNYRSVGGVKYGILPENVGYMHYSSFSYALGEGNLDAILGYCVSCAALIVDVRDNGGGSMTNVEMLVGRFTDKSVLAGSICHKTGPGHDDFQNRLSITSTRPVAGGLCGASRWLCFATGRHSRRLIISCRDERSSECDCSRCYYGWRFRYAVFF